MSKKFMFLGGVFVILILAGCNHVPGSSLQSAIQEEVNEHVNGDDHHMGDDDHMDDDDMDEHMNDGDRDDDDDEMGEHMDDEDIRMGSRMNDDNENKKNFDDGNVANVIKEISMNSYTEIIDGKYAPKFSVKNITVKLGDSVKIKITNTKGKHDFKIDEFDVFVDTPEGQEVVVSFTANKTGEFVYYCNQPGHRANGHWGTITIVE